MKYLLFSQHILIQFQYSVFFSLSGSNILIYIYPLHRTEMSKSIRLWGQKTSLCRRPHSFFSSRAFISFVDLDICLDFLWCWKIKLCSVLMRLKLRQLYCAGDALCLFTKGLLLSTMPPSHPNAAAWRKTFGVGSFQRMVSCSTLFKRCTSDRDIRNGRKRPHLSASYWAKDLNVPKFCSCHPKLFSFVDFNQLYSNMDL